MGSSSQVLLLLGLFHEYCDHKTREQFISSLSELPSNILVSTDSASGKALPSAFLLTLLTLLEGESLCEDNLPQSSSTLLRNAESNAKEPLTVAHFKYLIKISVDVNCPQLDATIMKLLQSSLLYVLYSTTSLLDSCFDNPSEAKIAVAAHLVVHSPSLRSHFELRCLSRSNTLKMKAHANTSPIQFKDYLKEFIPLVTSYLFCVHGLDQYISGMSQTRVNILTVRIDFRVTRLEMYHSCAFFDCTFYKIATCHAIADEDSRAKSMQCNTYRPKNNSRCYA